MRKKRSKVNNKTTKMPLNYVRAPFSVFYLDPVCLLPISRREKCDVERHKKVFLFIVINLAMVSWLIYKSTYTDRDFGEVQIVKHDKSTEKAHKFRQKFHSSFIYVVVEK
jgi:hypothetical protein